MWAVENRGILIRMQAYRFQRETEGSVVCKRFDPQRVADDVVNFNVLCESSVESPEIYQDS